MKIYFYLNTEKFSNCYLVTNEDTMNALIVDPCKISNEILMQIENGPYCLVAVLITHNHPAHVRGIDTLQKIYSPRIYAADYDVAQNDITVLKEQGTIMVSDFHIWYASVPGHSFDAMVYKIGHVLFTGDVLTAGLIGDTDSTYAKNTLITNIRSKILQKTDSLAVLPGNGPPTSIEAENAFNFMDSLQTSYIESL